MKIEVEVRGRSELVIDFAGRQYVRREIGEIWYEVASVGPRKTIYIDADERPWDHSHDGNGWDIAANDYTVGDAADDMMQQILDTAWETKIAIKNLSQHGYLDSLDEQTRKSRIAAEVEGQRVQRRCWRWVNYTLLRVGPQQFEMVPLKALNTKHRVRDPHFLMENEGKLWRCLTTGEMYRTLKNDAYTFVPADAPVTADEETVWETL